MKFESVQHYREALPEEPRTALDQLLDAVRAAAPGAEEVISYDIPTFQVDGRRFVHVAAWKKHLSLYPSPEEHEDPEGELAAYASGSGTLELPLGKPLPLDAVERMIRRRLTR
jgi:uncharacterized protein YdhG (YjbR/CyaY superfamily)